MANETETERLDYEFSYVATTKVDFDPKEFANMEVPAITDAVKEALRGINPAASYFIDDLTLAAEELYKANRAPEGN